MKTLLSKLNGNKTIICLAIVTIMSKMVEFSLIPNTNWIQFISWLFLALGTGAFYQHVKKGSFTENYK